MDNKPEFKPNPDLRLIDQFRQVLRYHHYSYRLDKHTVTGIYLSSNSMEAKNTPVMGSAQAILIRAP
jgi:hypothetical protein